MPRARLSTAEARRIALAAQGFAEPRRAEGRAIRRLFDRLALVQIDSVNVLSRAHYLPGFARLGAYDREALDKAAHYAPRRLFEYWGHEASLIDVELQQLLQDMLEQIRERGALAARELDGQRPRKSGPWWDWSDSKRAIEMLFWGGEVTSARRRNFERLYDLPERVLPKAVLDAPTPSEQDAQRSLVAIAARALGVAALPELRDYFRLPADAIRPRVAELVERGDLLPVEVEGWSVPAYLHREARLPRRVQACALLGPFDNLLWERGRVERLFGFRFRLEIYVPQPKRVYGYYVLPFLLGDRLVARVDLKADRQAGLLRAHATHLEDDAPDHTRQALHEELELLAGWLGLSGVDEASAAPAGRR